LRTVEIVSRMSDSRLSPIKFAGMVLLRREADI
jgi:hypothetical protein